MSDESEPSVELEPATRLCPIFLGKGEGRMRCEKDGSDFHTDHVAHHGGHVYRWNADLPRAGR
jgi:hypothetical protein